MAAARRLAALLQPRAALAEPCLGPQAWAWAGWARPASTRAGRRGGGNARLRPADPGAGGGGATVAIVGRPNVGKSALFNRLVGRRAALVMDTPGGHVTRDYREGSASLGDLRFTAVDTSGLEPFMAGASLQGRATALTAAVVARADAALLLLDARTGVTPGDAALAAWLRTATAPGRVIAAVNKAERAREAPAIAAAVAEAGGLGFGDAVGVSAETGEGMADLYAALQPLVDAAAGRWRGGGDEADGAGVATTLADEGGAADGGAAAAPIRLAIVGLPNAGKSTLVNRLLGQARSLTGPEPGLTRDAVRSAFAWSGRRVEVIDTAGWVRRAAAAGGRVPGGSVVDGRARPPGVASTGVRAAGTPAGGHVVVASGGGGGGTNSRLPPPASVGAAGAQAVALTLEAQDQAERGVDVAHCVVLVTDAAAAAAVGSTTETAPGGRSGGLRPPGAGHTLTRAEVAIATAAVAEGRGLVFVANKVDLLAGGAGGDDAAGTAAASSAAAAALARDVAARVPDAAGAPCLAMSAETGAGVDALMPAVAAVHAAWNRRVPTSRLNAWLADTVRELEAGGGGGRGGRGSGGSPAARDARRVRYVTQASVRPPGFVAFVRGGGGGDLAPSTRRLLAKRLRAAFGFDGVPLRLHVRAPAGGRGRRA